MPKAKSSAPEPIAIVGLGCRFPGADNPGQLWNLLDRGGASISEIPEDRMGNLDEIYSSEPATAGKIMSRFGGYLKQLDRFDAGFFGIAPREAELLDPQQRLLLEVAWEALEDAGQPVDPLRGSSTGVYVGSWLQDFETRLLGDPTSADLSEIDFYTTTGSGRYNLSGRLSFFFGWQGPSVTLDTACSSSLVAIHLACSALRSGECELALAGGVNVILSPYITVAYSQSRMMAQDGKCKFGDASGDGYVRSEGCGLVVLKTLSAARAAGDRIYAVIAGSAVNNDGRTSGFLATPGVEGQADLLRKAYKTAGIDPASVGYVEAHGTGTAAGDPVELEAIGQILGSGRDSKTPCLVGSIKTNMGHTEGAAGVAGVIKSALALRLGRLPASLHHVTPNPKIDWVGWKLKVPTEAQNWAVGAERRVAGVSAFGISGTNAHIVLSDEPDQADLVESAPAEGPAAATERLQLVPISAATPTALCELAERWASDLATRPADGSWLDHVRGAAIRRSALDVRAGILASNPEQLRERLLAFAENPESAEGVSSADPDVSHGKIVFVFPGQGSQWLGMARQLLREEPVFRASMERIAEAMKDELDRPLLDLLADPEPIEKINQVQPALFAIEVALADLWRSWGVEPDAVIGHSMGEAAAAVVAGAVSLEDSCKVICRRSRLMLKQAGKGLMTVVELTLDEAREALGPFEGRLSVAVNNSPRSCVVSGETEAMAEFIAGLESRDVYCRAVKVDVASHSPQMDPLKEDLLEALGSVRGRSGTVPIYSTVDGEPTDGAHYDAAYWVRNLRQPVLFAGMIERLVNDGHATFIEMSAHPILLPAVQQNLDALEVKGLTLASMRRDEDERAVALSSFGRLFAAGFNPDWSRLIAPGDGWQTPPLYPWQRERFWYHDAGPISRPAAKSSSGRRADGDHPDLQPLPQAEDRPGEWLFDLAGEDSLDLASADGLAAQWEWMIASGQAAAASTHANQAGALVDWRAGQDAPRHLNRMQVKVRRRGRKSFDMSLLGGGRLVSTAQWALADGEFQRQADGRWLDRAALAATIAPQLSEGNGAVGMQRLALPGASTTGLSTAPLPVDTHSLVYGVHWVAEEGAGARTRLTGRWIVLGTSAEAGASSLVRQLDDAGAEAVAVRPELAALSSALQEPTRGIVVALGGTEDSAASDVDEQMLEKLAPLRTLAAALSQMEGETRNETPRLYAVGLADKDDPAVAGAFGFISVMNFEISGIRATALDLAETPDDEEWRALIAELANDREDRRVRLRDGGREVARLGKPSAARRAHRPIAATDAPFAVYDSSLGDDVPYVEIAPRVPQRGELAVTLESANWESGSCRFAVGLVRAAGPEVSGYDPGRRVCGLPQLEPGQRLASEVTMRVDDLTEPSGPGQAEAVSLAQFVDYGVDSGARCSIRFDAQPDLLAAPVSGIRPSACYWITGGLGALGRGLADRLVSMGARKLVLTGRSEPGPAAKADLQRWQRSGVTVRTLRCDMADRDAVAQVIQTIDSELPPLAGVFHAAGVMDDAEIAALTDDQYRKVFAPKISGSVNLLTELGDRPLDHLLCFSSFVGVLGGPGQANYVTANAYMDALARRRHGRGQTVLTIGWGAWADLGMAERLSRERLESRGVGSMEPEVGWAVLEDQINVASPQLLAMQFDASAWTEAHVAIAGDPFFSEWVDQGKPGAEEPRDDLLTQLQTAGSAVAQRSILRDFVQRQVAAVLQSDLSRIAPTRPFRALGFDSLMTLELRNRLEPPTGLKLSATMVWNYPNVHALADFLLGRLEGSVAESTPEDSPAKPGPEPSSLDERAMEEMSEDDAEALLAAKMAELENLS